MKNANMFAFGKDNYKFLIIGLVINVIGFMLMIGGGTDDPAKFDADALFSPIRLTLSPILVISGYIVMIYAIMRRPKSSNNNNNDVKSAD